MNTIVGLTLHGQDGQNQRFKVEREEEGGESPEDLPITIHEDGDIHLDEILSADQMRGVEPCHAEIQTAINAAMKVARNQYLAAPIPDGAPEWPAGSGDHKSWSRSAAIKPPAVILPRGELRIEKSIWQPACVSVIGGNGSGEKNGTTIRVGKRADWKIKGNGYAWGTLNALQMLMGEMAGIYFVAEKGAAGLVTILGNLANWTMRDVHFLALGNPELIPVNHASIKHLQEWGLVSPVPAGHALILGSDVQLKECRFIGLQIEGGKCGMLIRGAYNCEIIDSTVFYTRQGIMLANQRDSRIQGCSVLGPRPTDSIQVPMEVAIGTFGENAMIFGCQILRAERGVIAMDSKAHAFINMFGEVKEFRNGSQAKVPKAWRPEKDIGVIPQKGGMWEV